MRNRKEKPDLDQKKLFKLYQATEEKRELLLETVRTLFFFLQEFALDIHDIDATGFKQQIKQLNEKYLSDDKPGSVRSLFKKHKKSIPAFISRQKNYLDAREKELKDIIDLLTKAITRINSDDQAFNRRLFEQSEKMEAISRLDDIRRIKNSLKAEVEQMRTVIHDKQSKDERQIKRLSTQVSALKTELEKTKEEASTDGLTKAYNRKAFDSYIQGLVEQSEVMKQPFALLLLDIDDFKAVNDTHGHGMGDRVLLAFANKCREHIREEDFFARYGGEEFAIVMPGASLRVAAKRGKQVCKAVASARYALEGGRSGGFLSVTTSVGVAVKKKGDTVQAIADRADQALYIAKKTGKNRVVTEKKIKKQ